MSHAAIVRAAIVRVAIVRFAIVRAAVLGAACLAPLALAAADVPEPGISDGAVFSETDGESLYRAICQGCHMPDGEGARGAGSYPALARNPRLAASAYPVLNVLNGLKGMPSFRAYLNDAQVAAVTNYVRTHMGNDYQDPVTASAVKAFRR